MKQQYIKNIFKWAGGILAGILVLILLVFAGMLLFLQTEYGQQKAGALIEAFTRQTPYHVNIEGFGGTPPWRMEFGRVVVSDAEGAWMILEDIRVTWALSYMVRMIYHLPSVHAERIHWHRIPQFEEAAETAPMGTESFSIPALPTLIVGELVISRLSIEENVFGSAQELKVEAGLDTRRKVFTALHPLKEPENSDDGIILEIEHDFDTEWLSVQVGVKEAPGGMVGTLMGLPDAGSIRMFVRGEGPVGDWQGVFSVIVEEYGESEGIVKISLEPEFSLSLAGKAIAEKRRIPPELASWFGNEADFKVRLAGTQEVLRLEEALVTSGPVDLSIDAVLDIPAQSLDMRVDVAFDELFAFSPVEGGVTFFTNDFDLFRVREFVLRSPGINVSGSGILQRERWWTEATVDIHITDAESFLGTSGNAFPDNLRISSEIHGSLELLEIDIALQAMAIGFEKWPETARTAAGEEVSLFTDLKLADSVISVRKFLLTGRQFELRGAGQADFEQERFAVTSEAFLHDLAILPGEAKGSLHIETNVSGGFSDFSVIGTARGTDVRLSGEPLVQPVASFSLLGLPSQIDGEVNLTAEYRQQPVEISGAFTLKDEEYLTVKKFEAQAPGLSIWADFQADLADKVLSGTAEGKAEDLSFLVALTGLEVKGEGTVKLEFLPVKDMQRTTVEINTQHLSFNGFSTSELVLTGEIQDTFVSPAGVVKVSLKEARTEIAELTRFDAEISGNLNSLDFRVAADGQAENPFSFTWSGAVTLLDTVRTVRIDELRGEYANFPIRLQQPTTLIMSDNRFRLTEMILLMDEGSLRAGGEVSPRETDVRIFLESFPVEFFSVVYPVPARGTLEGQLLLSGPPTGPVLEFDFSADLSIITDPDLPPLPSVLNATGVLEEKSFSASVWGTGLGPDPTRLEVSFPAVLTLIPLSLEVPPEGNLQGSLSGTADIQALTNFFPLDGHFLSGRVTLDLILEGTVGYPLLQGRILLAEGRYENYRLAMFMDRINATFLAQGPELILDSFSATDGESGRIMAEGIMSIDPDQYFSFSSSVNFRSFHALRTSELSTVVSGKLQLSGDARSARASGDLTLDPLQLAIADQTRPAIAKLEVREINVDPAKRLAESVDDPAYRVDLDLRLNFPARFFIRGRGLDAEFSGNLAVTGTAHEPIVRGTLSVVRGNFTFLDRRFEFTEANVIFTGATPPLPVLNVTAEWARRDITVRVRLTGSAMEPVINMESDPPLPSDEILSTVIFGRAVTDLTPIQALRLANALRVLTTGAEEGFAILGTLRTTFGLDELVIREGVNGAALDMGRYLHEKVYLRMSKGLGTGRDRAAVEVEVNRYVSVESEVGTDAQGGIGINYRRDF